MTGVCAKDLAAQLGETPECVRLLRPDASGRLERPIVMQMSGERPRRASATHDRRNRSVEGRSGSDRPRLRRLLALVGVAATAGLTGNALIPPGSDAADRAGPRCNPRAMRLPGRPDRAVGSRRRAWRGRHGRGYRARDTRLVATSR